MDIGVYRHYLEQYVWEAIEKSDGTHRGICEYLETIKIPRLLARNRFERQKALQEARKAFDEHRHWPVEIVLSHLGVRREGSTSN